MKRLIAITLAALALAMIFVSCNKDGDKNTGIGFWTVESNDATHSGNASLLHAWYCYDDVGGYSVLFLPKDDKEHWMDYNYAYVDMAESKVGEKHNLSDDLADDWDFWAGTKTMHIANKAYSGTVTLKINREKNNIVFSLNGTNEAGEKVFIEYAGYASPVQERPYPPYPFE